MGRNAKLKRQRKHWREMSTWCEPRTREPLFENFGVFCAQTGFLVYSATTYEEADGFCKHVNRCLKKHPLINPTDKSWLLWIDKHQDWLPDTSQMSTVADSNNGFKMELKHLEDQLETMKGQWNFSFSDYMLFRARYTQEMLESFESCQKVKQ